MDVDLFIAFVVAASVILIVPGPTILLVISQAVAHGRKSVLPLVMGVLFGDFTAMTFSLAGLGAVMSASASLFTVFKWIGAIYLAYLGIKLWRSPPENRSTPAPEIRASSLSLMKRSFLVTALNPKSIAFFVAFLPQFVDPLAPVVPQLLVLGGTFLLLATVNAALYAIFAGQLGDTMKNRTVRKWFHRCGGSVLIGAGIFTAGVQRTP